MAHSSTNLDLPLLSGPIPGLLDSSQSSRLLRTPTCSLFFAAFDPLTARANNLPNLSALHIDPGSSSDRVNCKTSGKRVVIETDPESGTCSWRFVPRVKVENEVLGDEGPWPRVVVLCGRLVRMTQDQWDIHKLDPEYDCFVPALPCVPTITRTMSTTHIVESDETSLSDPPHTPQMMPGSIDDMTPTPKAKRHAHHEDDSPRRRKKTMTASSADFDKMNVDEDLFYGPSMPVPQPTAEDVANKKRRRVSDRLGETSTIPRNKKETPTRTCAGSSVFAALSANGGRASATDLSPTPAKRVRTRSPNAVKRSMEQKRIDRQKKRKADMEKRLKERRKGMNRAFWEGIGLVTFDDDPQVAPVQSESDDSEACPGDYDSESILEDEADAETERLAKIEESRRKLAELEKDKPLWEESARKRQEREAEQEHIRQQARARRREEERLECARAARSQRETRSEEEQRREHEARLKEYRLRMFVTQPRSAFRWNSQRALERYVRSAAAFDAAKFSAGNPLTFASVPWPVLRGSFSVQDVDWDTVEAFFKETQRLLTPAEFKDLVEKSQRRFHPDRWRSRRLLLSLENETERDLLEVAGSTVAQVITPLWTQVTDR